MSVLPRSRPGRVLAACAVAGLLAAAVVAVPVWSLTRHLGVVRDELGVVEEVLDDPGLPGEPETARLRTAVGRIDDHADAARGIVRGPVWDGLVHLPVVGRSAVTVRDAVAVLETGARVGDLVVDDLSSLSALEPDGRIHGGVVPLDGLTVAAGLVERLPLGRLATARDRLAGRTRSLVPAPVDEARRRVLDASARLHGGLTRLGRMLDGAVVLLGRGTVRRYRLELRDGGSLTAPAVPVGDDALVLAAADGRLRLRTAGPAADGTLAVDWHGLSRLAAVLGPADLPDDLAAASGLPDPLPPGRIAALGRGAGPDRARAAVAAAVLRGVTRGAWDGSALARAVRDAAQTGHLRLVGTGPELRDAAATLDLDGG